MTGNRPTFALFVLIVLASALDVGCRKGPALDANTKHQVAARDAIAKGDTDTALRELDASIAAGPTASAYLDRAKIKHDKGDDAAAISDCEEGMKLEPEYAEVKWFHTELKKPKANQFKGAGAIPPSASK